MTVSEGITPWLLVVLVTVVGAALGVAFVRWVAPGILAAARGDGRGASDADAAAADGAGADAVSTAEDTVDRDGPPAVGEPAVRATADSSLASEPKLEPEQGGEPRPKPLTTVGTASVVERARAVAPVGSVEPDSEAGPSTPAPAPIEAATKPSAVEKADRLDPIGTPEPMRTAETVDVVAESTRIEAVGTTDEAGVNDTADAGAPVVCQYCGRDDFETAAQRNGHLRWCDEYDSDAAGAGDESEAVDTGGDTDGEHEEVDIVATYAAVREELEDEFDVDATRTSREFYHVCRMQGLDEERLAALERLTRAYEAVQYSDTPDLDADELRAAAACFETVEQ